MEADIEPLQLLPTVVHMSNNTHVTDVLGQVHKSTDLLDGELHHSASAALSTAISRKGRAEHDATEPPPEDCRGPGKQQDCSEHARLLHYVI